MVALDAYLISENILYAACIEIWRKEGHLGNVEPRLLKALRTNVHMHYRAISNEERVALTAEVDRQIFTKSTSAESFLRDYVEPQLAHSGCMHPEVWLLSGEEVFSHLRTRLSIEWLRRFPVLKPAPLNSLFEIAAQHGSRDELKQLIAERCARVMSDNPTRTDNEDFEQRRTFWLIRAWYFLSDVPETYWDWLKADKDTALILYEQSGQMNHQEHPYWPKLTSSKVAAILDAFINKWPKVALPNHWGTGSPKEEIAYRFLMDVIWSINADDPDNAIPVLNQMLNDPRFVDLHNNLRSIHASQIRKKALRDFEPPLPQEVVNRLDRDEVVTVEGLRQLVLLELMDYQQSIDGGEFNAADRFYEKGERLDEPRATEIIAERLSLRLEPQGIVLTPEHQLKDQNRSDFTVTKSIGGKRRLLVTEVKGQWHKDLYTAASAQLSQRYSIHPDAEQQGIFLAIWFGAHEKVAERKRHGIGSAQELKVRIEAELPQELKGLIDVFVLDVSRSQKPPKSVS